MYLKVLLLRHLLVIIYMTDIHKVSANLRFISYANDTPITSPLCSFTHGSNHDISLVTVWINLSLCKFHDGLPSANNRMYNCI